MKKSTILLLVIVYIASFLVVGFLGQAIKGYNPVYYPEAIELLEPDGIAYSITKDVVDSKTGEITYNYYYVVRPYKEGMSFRLKSIVKPDNCTYPDVRYFKDESDTSFNLETTDTNSSIEKNYAVITLNETPAPVITAKFNVSSTAPGSNIKLKIGVTFVNN